jgi:hypothetical protein
MNHSAIVETKYLYSLPRGEGSLKWRLDTLSKRFEPFWCRSYTHQMVFVQIF